MKKCDTPLAYYTRAFDHTEVRIHTREKHATSGPAKVFLGRVEMESRVKSFKRFWKSQDAQQEPEVELSLPSWGYCTRGLWFEDPVGVARRPEMFAWKREGADGSHPAEGAEQWTWGCGWAGAHGAMHALLHVFPLFVLADRRDLDAACMDEHEAPPMETCQHAAGTCPKCQSLFQASTCLTVACPGPPSPYDLRCKGRGQNTPHSEP